MKEKTVTNNEEVEIDLHRLFRALLSKAWLMGLAAILCALLTLLGTVFFVTPMYQSTAMFYVNNSALSSLSGDVLSSITSSDISASRGLVKTYIVILETRESLNDVIDYAGVDRTYSDLKQMITATSVDSTEIFKVVVTSDDPQEAEKIANAIAYILPNRIKNIIDGSSAKVVEYAVASSRPSSPDYTKNTFVGFAVGLALTALYILIRELVDTRVRAEEDITQSCKYPVLAAVPDMYSSKGGYGSLKKLTGKPGPSGDQTELVGRNISFASAEAYKLLRTKLQFSFADDEGGCRVIGVSSALTSEGKSLSSINLAYALSELGKRVLLIDCDMRCPTIHEKLPIKKTPGLSDYLSGQSPADNLLQFCGIKEDEKAFHAISSGRIPPNPMELLSSAKMEKMIARLRETYDYIILDLPPICEVSDSLAVAKLTDGILLVVRQNHCNRKALSSAVRQVEFVEARILGVVYNCTSDPADAYGRRYYNRYYKKEYRTAYRQPDRSKAGKTAKK